MDKQSLFNQIVASLQDAQKKAEHERDAAQKEANSHVGRMESRYDTFKEEAQYEVEAQELRISKYRSGINQINTLFANTSNLNPSTTIKIGSIVKLVSKTGEEKFYVLSPVGGGIVAKDGNVSVFTLTPDSPLGKQLLGLKIGDLCELNIAGSKNRCTVEEIF
ncbi:MAG: GreA/GreB family elongation factor [Minisyncoccia bacterium]|jgi:transcription elongation GreA/GreB family factor